MYNTTAHTDQDLTIRLARQEDSDSLVRLAERDSAKVPGGELLVAVVDGRMRAAVSVADGHAIADPFHPTYELVALLGERVSQLRSGGKGRRSRFGGLFGGRGNHRQRRGSMSPQPAGTLRPFN
jgi:hypothetical protein